jgi:hypothetical protein
MNACDEFLTDGMEEQDEPAMSAFDRMAEEGDRLYHEAKDG